MSPKLSATCMKVIYSLTFMLTLQPLFAQQFSDLDAVFQQKEKLLGKDYVVMIWTDTLVYKKENGGFNSKTQAPIASASKWLTAALVMTFVDEGKISLDDKITKWLPEFARYEKNYITIRDCLSHLTGIQSEGTLAAILKRRKYSSLEEEVNAFAAKEIQNNPGVEFRYSNIGLNIAGRVLEVISKKKFDALAKQRLFNPLEMRSTTFSDMKGGAVNPSGGAVSTADDYMHFLQMLMNKGVYKGKRILSEDAIAYLLKPQTITQQIKYAPKAAEGFNYASGSWVISEKTANGQRVATALASPGLFGTWPMIDFCRGYAYLFFVKNLLGEQRADAQLEIKKIIDRKLEKNCQ
ncbi:MAG: serine hydrolase [Chitinophagaceae bacterium]